MSSTDPLGSLTVGGDRATIRFLRSLPQLPDQVWSAVTTPDLVSQWMAPTSIDLRPGGRVEIDFGEGGHTGGTILVLDPPRTFEHQWHFESEGASVVRYEITPDGAGSTLAFTHRDLGTTFARGYVAGWHAYLDRLGALLDGVDVPDWDVRLAAVRPDYR